MAPAARTPGSRELTSRTARRRDQLRVPHRARSAKRGHANTLVRIEHDGIEGMGEASPSHYYGENRPLRRGRRSTRWAPRSATIRSRSTRSRRRLDDALQGHGAARAAIDMALHDWIGKQLGAAGVEAARARPRADAALVRDARHGVARGDGAEARDRDRVPDAQGQARRPGRRREPASASARATAGRMRVDANAAWSAADAVRVLRAIEPLDIELVEQPVAARATSTDCAGCASAAASRCSPTRAATACRDLANLAGPRRRREPQAR